MRVKAAPLGLALAQLIVLTGCSAPVRPRVVEVPRQQALLKSCDIVVTVLDAVVRPHDEQPVGLEKVCVEKYASLNRKIYVDARFAHDGELEMTGDPECRRAGYVVRLNEKTFEPAPTDTVVLIYLDRKGPETFKFNAITEDHLWPERNAKGIYSSSPCFSSSGVAIFDPKGGAHVAFNGPPPDGDR